MLYGSVADRKKSLIYRLLEIWNPLADERTALNDKEDMIVYTYIT